MLESGSWGHSVLQTPALVQKRLGVQESKQDISKVVYLTESGRSTKCITAL